MADDAGALLVRAGLITAEHLATARASQHQDGGTISEHLVVSGMVTDERLTEFYRTRLLVPQVHPNTLARLSPSIIGLLPADLAAELRAVPVALDREGNLTVAMSDPSDRHAVDEIGFFTGKYVVRAVATQMQIAWCLAQYYDCLTELGERLLQPAAATPAPAAPAPAPVPAAVPTPATVAPLIARSGDTNRIEASRHKVLAPVTTPPPTTQARPSGASLDRSGQTPLPGLAPMSSVTPMRGVAPPPNAVPLPGVAPLPAGAFGGDTPPPPMPPRGWPGVSVLAKGGTGAQTPIPPPPSRSTPTPAPVPIAVAAPAPAPVEPPAPEPAPVVAASRGFGPPDPSLSAFEHAPETSPDAFDDTPSIIISVEATRPTRERPAVPDPPELYARAGELQSTRVTHRDFDAPTVSIEINLGDEPEDTEIADGPPTAELSAPTAELTAPTAEIAAATAEIAAATEAVASTTSEAAAPIGEAAPTTAAPNAPTGPMVTAAPPPPTDLGVVDGGDRNDRSGPMIDVVAAEPSGPSRSAIPIAAMPDAETRRVAGPVLATIAQLGPPAVPAPSDRDAVPVAIAEPGPAARAADTEPGASSAEDDDEAAVIHARRPDDSNAAAAAADRDDAGHDADGDDAAEPILLLTPRRSGEMSVPPPVEPDPAPPARSQAIVVEAIEDQSAPVLLTERMRRREARRREKGTMIGIGSLGPIPYSVEPTPTPYAPPSHAAPAPRPAAAAPTAIGSAAVAEAFGEDAVATVRATSLRFVEHDALDDGWGAPGTTIPPGFLGAVTAPIDDGPSEQLSVPVAIAPERHDDTRRGSNPNLRLPATTPPPPEPRATSQPSIPIPRITPTSQPSIPVPRITPPYPRPAATLTPLNRNRTVAGVPDPTHLADLLAEASQRLVELLHALDGATHRDHVIAMLVDFVGESHHRVAFLALRGDDLTPFMQIPEPTGPPARLDLSSAATFQDVIGTRLPYRGPISDVASRELVRALFGSATDEMLVVPVAVRDRVVGVIYADGRHRHSFDEHVTVAGRAAGLALQRILKGRTKP